MMRMSLLLLAAGLSAAPASARMAERKAAAIRQQVEALVQRWSDAG